MELAQDILKNIVVILCCEKQRAFFYLTPRKIFQKQGNWSIR
jgi:hypothetical protein